MCSTRNQKAPTRLSDYVCYNTTAKDPFLSAQHPHKESLGTPYQIANYVTCTNFSISHQNFPVAITKVTKPKYYDEAIKDSR